MFWVFTALYPDEDKCGGGGLQVDNPVIVGSGGTPPGKFKKMRLSRDIQGGGGYRHPPPNLHETLSMRWNIKTRIHEVGYIELCVLAQEHFLSFICQCNLKYPEIENVVSLKIVTYFMSY